MPALRDTAGRDRSMLGLPPIQHRLRGLPAISGAPLPPSSAIAVSIGNGCRCAGDEVRPAGRPRTSGDGDARGPARVPWASDRSGPREPTPMKRAVRFVAVHRCRDGRADGRARAAMGGPRPSTLGAVLDPPRWSLWRDRRVRGLTHRRGGPAPPARANRLEARYRSEGRVPERGLQREPLTIAQDLDVHRVAG